MALLPASPSGGDITYTAASGGGDTYANHGAERLHVKNGSGSGITVSVVHQLACNQGVVHSPDTYVVPAGAGFLIPALDPGKYNDPATGLVHLTYSGVTTLTVAVLAP